ncbi:MAG TPA: hypothetical protein PKY96_15945 [Flavobacteriales bacterium]|nr:hypothetical protein [Flavobacteriales bacterium]
MRSILLPFALLALVAHAQQTVQVSSFSFSTGIHPTLSFQFEGTDVKYVESWWKDELKRVSRDVSNKKEVVAAGALMPQVSPDTVRVLMKAEQRKGAPFVMAHVALLTQEGWLSPSSDMRSFEAAKAYVHQQSTLLRRQLAQQELTTAEKGLAKLNSELSMLQREKERAEASIVKANERAVEAIAEKERLAKEAEEQAKRVEAQRKENATDPSAEGEKELAELVKQQAKLQEKRSKAIAEEAQQKKKGEELAWEVKKNLQDQDRKRAEISKQEQLVKAMREKLESIR